MTTAAVLDEIDRIHDDQPEAAGAALRAFDAPGLPVDRLPLLAFLTIHVLGEKLGQWSDAADRLERLLATRPDAPLAVLAHAAAAAHLAGRADSQPLAALSAAGGAMQAQLLVALSALGLRPPPEPAALAAGLARLAHESRGFDPGGPLDERLAIGFNNTTSRLLDLTLAPVDPEVGAALLAGSAAALRFWEAAGTWVHLERALYLRALVHNRIDEPAAARADCVRALEVIAANGSEEIDQAFLQLQLAGALLRLGETIEGQRHLAEARAAADRWDDAGLRSWFAGEHDRLFGSAEKRA